MIKNETERGWLAGIMEGEGTFGLQRGKYQNIQLSSTDADVVYRIKELVGMGSVCEVRSRGPQVQYMYTASKKASIEIMLTIRDLMSERRRKRIDELLAS